MVWRNRLKSEDNIKTDPVKNTGAFYINFDAFSSLDIVGNFRVT